MTQLDRNIALFGTDQPIAAPRVIEAGRLTLELDDGALRRITFDGIEVLRAVAFLIRDVNWGTYQPEIANLQIQEESGAFQVEYDAVCADDSQAFRYHASITYTADDGLLFSVAGQAQGPFHTNRLGFIVLHPLAGVAGEPVDITHVDGTSARSTFPRHISPGQPIFAIRALRHQVRPGVWATCTMTGDAYEMEDQRNWTDASFKTYIRPLSEPLPYTVGPEEKVVQTIALTFEAAAASPGTAQSAGDIALSYNPATAGVMPDIGLAISPDIALASQDVIPLLRRLGPQFLVCGYDPRSGTDPLPHYRQLSEKIDAAVTLELALPAQDTPAAEASATAAALAAAGLRPQAVTVCPAPLLKSYQPDAIWPDLPPLAEYYAAARAAFPHAAIGGGMLNYFTELNRCWPASADIDYITHTTCATVHDAGDRAVMETLEALPYVIETTKAKLSMPDYRIGPSAIGMRQNPYGADVAANPDNRRVAMARQDPRHRGIFGATWTLAYTAAAARADITALTLAAPVGPFGVIHHPDWPAPYYDSTDGQELYPLFHVLAGLARAAGRPRIGISSSSPHQVDVVAWQAGDHIACWLANLTDEPVSVSLADLPGPPKSCHLLDADNFAPASTDPDHLQSSPAHAVIAGKLALQPYAVAVLRLSPA